MLIFLVQFWLKKCLLALANTSFSGQNWAHSFCLKVLKQKLATGWRDNFRNILERSCYSLIESRKPYERVPVPPPIKHLPIVCPVGTSSTRYKTRLSRKRLAMWLITVCLFFDRTYEILINGGTLFNTGVDLDSSISLKGNQPISLLSIL